MIAEFELSVTSASALQDVREKVQQVRAVFKPEVKEPLIQRFNPDDQPIVSIAVRSGIRSVRDLTTLSDQVIVKRLQTVRDVGRVTIVGGLKRQINIELDPGRMHSLRVGVNDIMRAIRDENQNFPAGNVQRGNDDRVIEITGRVAEPGSFADLIVARRGLAPVYLRQVATVVDSQQELENIAVLNGERAVALDVVPERLAIDDALAQLPEEFRAPVVLRDLCDLDYAEIAETLGIPPGTVRSRIARGRAALARQLSAGNQASPSGRPTTVDEPPTTP